MTFLLRDGQLVTSAGVVRADLALEEGRIVEIAASIRGRSGEELDLGGAFVFPGFVDVHVHFNEPGRADWEGIASGSRAFAAGGGTVFCDMPLNSDPPVLSAAGVDFFRIWGGISGCQHGFPAFLGEWHHRFPHRLPEATAWLSGTPARRFRLTGKGTIEVVADADLTVIEFGEPRDPAVALYRHKSHLYEFHCPRCSVVHVFRRGEYLVRAGLPVPPLGRGRFLQPTLSHVPSPK